MFDGFFFPRVQYNRGFLENKVQPLINNCAAEKKMGRLSTTSEERGLK
jgi:hypothetical protein